MIGSQAVSKANATLLGLAEEVQRTLEECKTKGRHLYGSINMIDRKYLELEVESMKLRTKDKRSDFFEAAWELLSEKSNDWFAFFLVQTLV